MLNDHLKYPTFRVDAFLPRLTRVQHYIQLSAVFTALFMGAFQCSIADDAAQSTSDFHRWAATPPLGWNSWDCFGTTLSEAQAKAQADAMARQLQPYGWTFFTVDIQWYEGASQGHAYTAGAPLSMDEYSRLVPAPRKFPSATNGAGFKPLESLKSQIQCNQVKFLRSRFF